MKQFIVRTALTAGLTLGSLGMAGMASAAQTTPGTPGTPNCEGQTMAYLAQAGKADFDAPGLGNLSRFAGLSVKEVHDIVTTYCAQ